MEVCGEVKQGIKMSVKVRGLLASLSGRNSRVDCEEPADAVFVKGGPNGLTPGNELGRELRESEGSRLTYFCPLKGHFLHGIDSFLFTYSWGGSVYTRFLEYNRYSHLTFELRLSSSSR